MRAWDIVFFCICLQVGAYLVGEYNIMASPYEDQCFNFTTYSLDVCYTENLTDINFAGKDIYNESWLNSSISNSTSLSIRQIEPGLFAALDLAGIVLKIIGMFFGALTALYDIMYPIFGFPIAASTQLLVDSILAFGVAQFITGRGAKVIE